MNPNDTIDVRIWQAIIAGGFVAVGWLVNGWRSRREAASLRAEKLRDYHRALYAEIGATLANLWGEENLRRSADNIIKRMRVDDGFVPLIPREHGDYVFNALVTEIHILPRRTIDPIVAYYSQIKAVAAHADDMRGDAFRALAQERRIEMYSDYIEMKEQLRDFGVYANRLIRAFAEGGNAGADAAAARLNSQVLVPSDPLQGSG